MSVNSWHILCVLSKGKASSLRPVITRWNFLTMYSSRSFWSPSALLPSVWINHWRRVVKRGQLAVLMTQCEASGKPPRCSGVVSCVSVATPLGGGMRGVIQALGKLWIVRSLHNKVIAFVVSQIAFASRPSRVGCDYNYGLWIKQNLPPYLDSRCCVACSILSGAPTKVKVCID